MAGRAGLKELASTAVDACREELYQLSEQIWKNPELCFKEYKAHELLTGFLEKKGFAVERSFTGIETAFRATFGSGRPNVCVICEYDALPEIGHACGHNLIAEAGVAAGLGLKAALESKGVPQGCVTVLGTPAEEGGGGKVYLIENGAFEDVDIAMMVHPAPTCDLVASYLALAVLKVIFTGKASHAAAFPWEGINALDAAVLAYNSISVLRQQMKPTWRVHSVIKNGGVAANVIPEATEIECMVRTPDREELKTFMVKVKSCFEAAAIATGCQVEIMEVGKIYENVLSNQVLANVYGKNWKSLGVEFRDSAATSASTDMGNVSHIVPSIHPKYGIGSGKEVNHTRDFTRVAHISEAHSATLTAAKALAHTGIDVLTTEGLLEEIKTQFKKDTAV